MRDEERVSGRYRYLTDGELEALIAEVEDHEMLAPPVYLKELVMEEAVKSESAAEPVNPVRSVEPAGPVKRSGIDRKTAKIQLMVYSLKIIGAAAAAIFCLTMVPMEMSGSMEDMGNRRMEEAIEQDVAHYREESRRILAEPVEKDEGERGFGSFLGNMFGIGKENGIGTEGGETISSIWKDVTGWFGNGGKE